MTDLNLEIEAGKFIAIAKAQAYGVDNSTKETEGDYGSWDDWKYVLIQFGNRVLNLEREELSRLITERIQSPFDVEKNR